MRDGDLLQGDFEAQLAQFGGHVFGGGASLRRAGEARSDVFGEVGELAVGVVVVERGGLYRRELLEKQWRKIVLRGLGSLRGSHKRWDGLRLRRRILSADGRG